jgi:hypothetical protein
MFWLNDPKDQQRITVARCWCHELLEASSSPDDASMGFVWSDQNIYREKNPHIVVRLTYIGPGTAPVTFPDYVHDKVSGTLYAFNRLDSSVLWEMRFGLRKRMVGCYLPSAPITTWDDLGWYFGNKAAVVRAPAGRSHYYDDTKNLASATHNSVGGFHACKRARFAGNEFSSIILGAFGNAAAWCTSENPDPTTLPDPLAAGGIKGARSLDGITYAADNPADPDVGIKIRAHSGTITEEAAACIDWAQNINSLPGSAAPASWLSELLAEHPWIEDICPDPTSLTGGSGSTAPWAVAQALTRGDASNPNTGPFRDTAGGLP